MFKVTRFLNYHCTPSATSC